MLEIAASLRERILRLASALEWLPPTLARLCVGWVFLVSGWGKLHHLEEVTGYFASLGIPAPGFQTLLAATAELVCGALVLAGLLTRLASVPLVVVMIVAIATARRGDLDGAMALYGFIEYLYILLLLYLGVNGPGPLSADALLARRLPAGRGRRASPAGAGAI